MDAERGVSLLANLWPKIDLALSKESRADRLRFITDLLRTFQANGVDLSQVLRIDEDIRLCAENLGAMPPKPKKRTGAFVLDTSGIGDPCDYELIGGPFDGASISLGAGLYEMPPSRVTLHASDQSTRMDDETSYELQQITERDQNGEPTGSYLAYLHSDKSSR
ncbi:hypothetical protein U8335_26655 [Roseiconus lacunae]|uniref:hypothetical protein n=1 Tax=Roseiconus lacunae TaxID=2605694 RepID=UPI003088B235|nr:hypothetical protein U8335_26655 [Stieleria sp. HD01]